MKNLKPLLVGHIVDIISTNIKISLNKQINKTMKKKHKIITVFASAAITFGALWMTLGADHFNKRHRYHYEQYYNCDDQADVESNDNE
jgi:hypothetical protein